MLKPLSFNDWLELYMDDLPEEGDIDAMYKEYVAAVDEMNLESQLINLM